MTTRPSSRRVTAHDVHRALDAVEIPRVWPDEGAVPPVSTAVDCQP
jgi:hypothetical protein